ncbi:MAG: hypothetical protein H6744_09450 [Deltaproteobacteria bacterium]|nr:hypothetical protein [Deltaproteobacteria bacterium]
MTLLVATALLSGCPNRGVRGDEYVVEGDRALYPVTVFTNDQAVGEKLLAAIRERGYTHTEGEVMGNPNEEFNIKWGGAPISMVHELAAMVKERYGHELRLLQIFEPGDNDIFINLPLGSTNADSGAPGPALPDEITRSHVHIVVFSEDEVVAQRTLDDLKAMGYDNPENSFQDMPNDNFNVKWGATPEEFVEEIATMLEKKFGAEFRRSHEFAPADLDLFINLPEAPKPPPDI